MQIMTKEQATGLFEDLAWSEMPGGYVIDSILYFLASMKYRINENHLDAQDFISDLERYIYGEMTRHGNSQRDKYIENIVERLRTFDYENKDLPTPQEAVLDLSKHSTKEDECLDLAKNVSQIIASPETPEEKRKTLNQMVGEMISTGLETYPPQVVEAFLCAPENQSWHKHFLEEIKGENNA